jgi:hypothetical protein
VKEEVKAEIKEPINVEEPVVPKAVSKATETK